MTIREALADDHDALTDIWLRSVKATQTFLTEQDSHALVPEVQYALDKLESWFLSGQYAIGFLGHSPEIILSFRNRIASRSLCPPRPKGLLFAPEKEQSQRNFELIEFT